MANVLMSAVAVAVLLLTGGSGATPDRVSEPVRPPMAPDAALDRALDRGLENTGTAGAAAAVVVDGRLIWSGAAGRATLGRGGGMRTRSMIPLASTTKTVTAALAMALAEEGRLDLDRPVDDVLPDLPGSHRITTRMLLGHRSGLGDYFSDGGVARKAARHPFRRWDRDEVLAHVHGLRFEPGSRHAYSNSGYVALGGVIEQSAGAGVEEVFAERIAGPLGLGEATFRYRGAPERLIAHPLAPRGHGRWRDRFAGGRIHSDYWGEVWTDGGLVAGAPELATIGNGIYSGDLLEPATVEAMLPPRRSGWGLGTFDRRAAGRTWIGHDGSYGGYTSENWTDRQGGLTVAVVANGPGAFRTWRQIATAAVDPARAGRISSRE